VKAGFCFVTKSSHLGIMCWIYLDFEPAITSFLTPRTLKVSSAI